MNKWAVFSLNLDRDITRFEAQQASLKAQSIDVTRIPALRGASLPEVIYDFVPGLNPEEPGTVGCFLSHIRSWEALLKSDADWGVILEDDAMIEEGFFEILNRIDCPKHDLTFINNRMVPLDADGDELVVSIIEAILSRKDLQQIACGGDGYILTRSGAEELLELVRKCGVKSDVDWFLLYCAIGDNGLSNISDNQSFHRKISFFSDFYKLEAAILTAACTRKALVSHKGNYKSSRILENKGEL
ncbi:glycosyltransferase family 25 protein [Donghicola mangrovi]|uniref:Glycosyl transferase family 25 domain-containing protein n=1 Tax=Donghicola mangrovi TaxID=2729614 RepID=A0A850QHA6_9RHOB|nr:hypothetical protein [Donghicola mangrovi]